MTALEIDETLVEAHGALAFTIHQFDWDWSGAERHYRRAIELNPSLGNSGHHGYALLLSAAGRHDEAIAMIKRAEVLDPLTLPLKDSVGLVYLMARRYDDAIEKFRSLLALDPASPLLSWWHEGLGKAYGFKGQHEDAITEFQRAVDLSGGEPTSKAWLAWAFAVAGRTSEAKEILEELKEPSKQRPAAYDVAVVYTALGEKALAFEQLNEALEARVYWVSFLKVAPEFDSLHSDPRFQDLLRRMNFPE